MGKSSLNQTYLNKLAQEVHENSVVHGWWERNPSFPEIIALCHSELSEALEAYRGGLDGLYHVCGKPDGIPAELADCILRILDYCAFAEIDIDGAIYEKMVYNRSRPYRHGNKRC